MTRRRYQSGDRVTVRTPVTRTPVAATVDRCEKQRIYVRYDDGRLASVSYTRVIAGQAARV